MNEIRGSAAGHLLQTPQNVWNAIFSFVTPTSFNTRPPISVDLENIRNASSLFHRPVQRFLPLLEPQCHRIPQEIWESVFYFLNAPVEPYQTELFCDTENLCRVARCFNEAVNGFRNLLWQQLSEHPQIAILMETAFDVKDPSKPIKYRMKWLTNQLLAMRAGIKTWEVTRSSENHVGDRLYQIIDLIDRGVTAELHHCIIQSGKAHLLVQIHPSHISINMWETGFITAVAMGNLSLVESLYQPSIRSIEYRHLPSMQNKAILSRALFRAVQYNHLDVIQFLLQLKRKFNVDSALGEILKKKNHSVLRSLLTSNKEISNVCNPRVGIDSAESAPCPGYQTAILLAIKNNDLEGIDILLRHSSPQLEILEHARDYAEMTRIRIRASTLFPGQGALFYPGESVLNWYCDGRDEERRRIRASLPSRFKNIPKCSDSITILFDLVHWGLATENTHLDAIIERLDREMVRRRSK